MITAESVDKILHTRQMQTRFQGLLKMITIDILIIHYKIQIKMRYKSASFFFLQQDF